MQLAKRGVQSKVRAVIESCRSNLARFSKQPCLARVGVICSSVTPETAESGGKVEAQLWVTLANDSLVAFSEES